MKSTKKSLIASALSLVLCISMLLGTTYAWFTDSVTSGKNKIIAGNLDVELKHYTTNPASATDVQGKTDLFDVDLWEPGVIAWENLTVTNVGNLALKYVLNLNVFDKNATTAGHDLTEVIKVAVIENGFSGDRAAAQALSFDTLADFQKTGNLEGGDITGDTFGVVLYWEPTDHDNLYNLKNGLASTDGQPLFVEFGVNLVATQDTVEADSFDKYYDQGTAIAVVTNGNASKVEIDATPDVDSDKPTTIEFEDGAFTGNGTLELTIDVKDVPPASHFSIKEDAGTVASIDLNAVFNGVDVSQFNGKKVTVTTYIAKGLNANKLSVVYTGADAQPTEISYDSETGKLVFSTTHFSEYLVTEDTVVAYDIATKNFHHDLSKVIFHGDNDIILLKNVHLDGKGITFETDTNSKLDLNGYVIFGISNVQGTSALILNKGNLKISDNTDVNKDGTGKGAITNIAYNPDTDWDPNNQPYEYPSYANNTITNSGSLVIESGFIESNTGAGACYSIDNNSSGGNAIITVNGGRIAHTDNNFAIRMFCNSTTNMNKIIVNGGEIVGTRAIWLQLPGNSSQEKLADLVINGGTLTSYDTEYNMVFYSYSYGDLFTKTNVTVNGGIFNGDFAFTGGTNRNTHENVVILDGTFNGQYGFYAYKGYDFEYQEDGSYILK